MGRAGSNWKNSYKTFVILAGMVIPVLFGCGSKDANKAGTNSVQTGAANEAASELEPSERVKGSRDNTPVCLVPVASGEDVYENEFAHLDASNISDGYVVIRYTGTCPKVKLQITGPDQTKYTYNLTTSALLYHTHVL